MKTSVLSEPVLFKKILGKSTRKRAKKHRFIARFFLIFYCVGMRGNEGTLGIYDTDGICDTEWAIYIIFQANGTLASAADTAIKDLQAGLASRNENKILLHVEMIKNDVMERYALSPEGCKCIEVSYQPHILSVLKRGCSIAFRKPAKRRLLIFSGHGTGILEPSWNEDTRKWEYELDTGDSPFTYYRRMQTATLLTQLAHTWDGKSLFTQTTQHEGLSTADLSELMRFVSKDILAGDIVDIVGFDACHMAMLEIAYEMKEYARYFIASQEWEEKEGWNYANLLATLNQEPELCEIPRKIVYGYDAHQRQIGQSHYSLSAFNLSYVKSMADALDYIITCMEAVLHTPQTSEFLWAICRARHHNQCFSSILMYVDLFRFLETLLCEIDLLRATNEMVCLKRALIEGITQLNYMIIAHGFGNACSLARGCSVYFPLAHIDNSYKNAFARKHRWDSFLQRIMATGFLMSSQP